MTQRRARAREAIPVATRKPVAIRIRPAVAADAEFILSLAPRFVAFELPKGRRKRVITKATRTFIDQALRAHAPTGSFLIAEDARHAPAGFVQLRLERDFFSGAPTVHVANLAVAAEHEGRGVGRALLRAAQRWARTRHCGRLTLNVFPGNARARALYERAGFTIELLRMTKPVGRR